VGLPQLERAYSNFRQKEGGKNDVPDYPYFLYYKRREREALIGIPFDMEVSVCGKKRKRRNNNNGRREKKRDRPPKKDPYRIGATSRASSKRKKEKGEPFSQGTSGHRKEGKKKEGEFRRKRGEASLELTARHSPQLRRGGKKEEGDWNDFI